jgi:two-component system LytT family sensor kinase
MRITFDPLISGLIIKACVMVTIATVLTNTRLFKSICRPRLQLSDQATAIGLFLILALAEGLVATARDLPNARIVAVCASGLLAGPWVGGIIGVAATVLSHFLVGTPPVPVALSMVLGGVACGLVRQRQPRLALRLDVGFLVGALVSASRDVMVLALGGKPSDNPLAAAMLTGVAVALILLVIRQVREQENHARAAAISEVRALQARMNPHFLFNALNTLSALSRIDPKQVPSVASGLGAFLRASVDRDERTHVPLSEELAIVRAYLRVEALRLGERLYVEEDIDPEALDTLVPPFVLQPLVENAIRHGIEPAVGGGTVRITASSAGKRLLLTVRDTGVGLAPPNGSTLFDSRDGHAHALGLLDRRLSALYGRNYALAVREDAGHGVISTVEIPLSGVNRHLRETGSPSTQPAAYSDRISTNG